jgi:hypothetical protein
MMSRQEEVCFLWGVEVKNAMAGLRNCVVQYGQRLASVEKEGTIEAVSLLTWVHVGMEGHVALLWIQGPDRFPLNPL